MSSHYVVGVDLGTTYTCAAVADSTSNRVVQLTGTSQTIPSVVSINGDEVIAGEAAERRLVTNPSETAREFKRRFGDPAPLVLGGAAYGSEVVTSHLLREVLRRTAQVEGAPAAAVGLAHPASWGPFRLDLLREAAALAGVEHVELVPEPVAAAVANRARVDEGSLVAVYDLGGGTFDAAVVRCDGDWSVVGTPEGVERLGGVDFDQAIMAHVDSVLDGQVFSLDTSDPEARSALMQLRSECQQAKEHLSQDTDVEIPVSLPNVRTSVRLTRSEFEAMVRPRLADSLSVLDRVVASAGVGWDDIAHVLLVGGSSNIPAVGQAVSEHTGRPVMTATNPHLAIAIGTAAVTERRLAPAAPVAESVAPTGDSSAPAAPAPAPAPAKNKPIGAIVGALVAVAAIAVGAVLFLGGGDDSGDAVAVTTEAPTGEAPTGEAPTGEAPTGDDPDTTTPDEPATATETTTTSATTTETTTELPERQIDEPPTLDPIGAATFDSCTDAADGVSDIAITTGRMFLVTEGGIVAEDVEAVSGCSLDPAGATPAGFEWTAPVTHLSKAGTKLAIAGPDGGALASPGRAEVIACPALTGPLAAASDERFFVVTDDGLLDVRFDGGTCAATTFLPASEFTVTDLDATRNLVVVGGIDAAGTTAVRMWSRQAEIPVAPGIEFGSIDAVEGCTEAVCVFDLENRVVHRIGEDGGLVEQLALPGQPAPLVSIDGSAGDDGMPYIVASFADGSVHVLRLTN